MNGSSIACTLSSPDLRARKEGLLRRLVASARAIESVGEGLRILLPPEDGSLELALQVIRAERSCCPFLQFDLRCPPGGEPIELALSGPEGTRAFLDDLLKLDGAQEKVD